MCTSSVVQQLKEKFLGAERRRVEVEEE